MKIFNKKILGLLISIFFIALIIRQVDIGKTLESFKTINVWYLLMVLPLYYGNFIFRAIRWRAILNQNPLSMKSVINALFIGYAANCLLPARMGEVYRAHLFGKKENISRLKVFASIVLERIFDGIVLFFILLLFISLFYSKPWLIKLNCGVGSIFIGSLIGLFIFARLGKSENFCKITRNVFFEKLLSKLPLSIQTMINRAIVKINSFIILFVDGLDIFKSVKLFSISMFLSALIWLIEGIVMFFIIKSFGIPITPVSSLFILSITTFSTMIPAGPASIGPYQYGYILAMSIFGVNQETALAVSIINQSFLILAVVAAGLFCVWKEHISLKELEDNAQIEKPILVSE